MQSLYLELFLSTFSEIILLIQRYLKFNLCEESLVYGQKRFLWNNFVVQN